MKTGREPNKKRKPVPIRADACPAPTPDVRREYAVGDAVPKRSSSLIAPDTQNEKPGKLQRENRAVRDKYVALYDHAPVGCLTLTPDGIITEANRTAAALLGTTKRRLVNQAFVRFVAPDFRDAFHLHIDTALRKKTRQHCDLDLANPDGSRIHILLQSVADGARTPGQGRIQSAMIDITQRKRMEDTLWESEEKYRQLFQNESDAVLIFDADTRRLEDGNRAALDLYGYDREAFVELTIEDLSAEKKKTLAAVQRILAREPGSLHIPFRKKDGTVFPGEVSAGTFFSKGRLKVIGAVRDITQRRQAEAALRRSESQKQALLDASPDRIRYVDADLRIIWANKTVYTDLRIPREEIIGQYCHALFRGIDTPCEGCTSVKARSTRQVERGIIHSPGRGGTGTGTYWDTYSMPLTDEKGEVTGFIQITRNITEQKKAEEALRQNEKRFRNIVESAPFGYFRVGTDGLWQYVNPEWERMYGHSFRELAGRHFESMPSDDRFPLTAENVRSVLAGKGMKGAAKRGLKDGSDGYIEFSIQPVVQNGGIAAIEGFINDLTERKRTEDLVHNLSQMLMQAQERERQMLSYELHDRIAQNLSILKIGCDTLFADQQAVSAILQKRAEQLSGLLQQTIADVRNMAYELRPPGLDEMGLVNGIEMYCGEFSESTGLSVAFHAAGIDRLDLNEDIKIQIYRLVQEGLNNIRKHADASHITIRLAGAFPNVILRIEDDGKGFDVEARQRTLDNEKRMGLRSMQERVNMLQGRMTIQSRPMQGTRIFIKFPAKEPGHGAPNDHRYH